MELRCPSGLIDWLLWARNCPSSRSPFPRSGLLPCSRLVAHLFSFRRCLVLFYCFRNSLLECCLDECTVSPVILLLNHAFGVFNENHSCATLEFIKSYLYQYPISPFEGILLLTPMSQFRICFLHFLEVLCVVKKLRHILRSFCCMVHPYYLLFEWTRQFSSSPDASVVLFVRWLGSILNDSTASTLLSWLQHESFSRQAPNPQMDNVR